jgi:hypothetical protein
VANSNASAVKVVWKSGLPLLWTSKVQILVTITLSVQYFEDGFELQSYFPFLFFMSETEYDEAISCLLQMKDIVE